MNDIEELAKTCNTEEKFAEFAEKIKNIDNINVKFNGNTLLIIVCWHNHTEFAPKLIELLLNNGADPNMTDDKYGSTPLMFALQNNNTKHIVNVAELLINGGTNIDKQNNAGHTALIYVVYDTMRIHRTHKYTKCIVKLLLNSNVNVNIKDNYNYRATQICKDKKIIKLLLPHTILDFPIDKKIAKIISRMKDKEIAKLKNENEELKNKIAELEDIIRYIPDNEGYNDCKLHFEGLVNGDITE